MTIADVAPALFSANATGCGVAAAMATRVGLDGSQTTQLVFRYDEARGRQVPTPVELGSESDVVVLSLYGTGFRLRSTLGAVSVRIGGQSVDALYAGAQPQFPGLDQLNVKVPRSMAGRPEVEIAVTVDGKSANAVSVNLGGQTPAPRIASVTPNTVQPGQSSDNLTITGENLLGVYRIRVASAQGVTATVLRTSATMVVARLVVAADASPGDRQLSVESDRGESAAATLSIRPAVPPLPRITAVTPTGAEAGLTVADLSIDGENLAAVTAVEFTPAAGITVSNLRTTGTRVTVRAVIVANAAVVAGRSGWSHRADGRTR